MVDKRLMDATTEHLKKNHYVDHMIKTLEDRLEAVIKTDDVFGCALVAGIVALKAFPREETKKASA